MSFDWLNKDSRTFLSRGYLPKGQSAEDRIREIADTAEEMLDVEGFADKFYRTSVTIADCRSRVTVRTSVTTSLRSLVRPPKSVCRPNTVPAPRVTLAIFVREVQRSRLVVPQTARSTL